MEKMHRDIVGGFIFSKDGKLLLGQNKRGGVYEGLFVVPAGGVEEGESTEEALKREMLEETGIDISGAKITPFRTSTGQSEKTIDGKRVLVEMNFFDYRVDLDKNADEVTITTSSDWHNNKWFEMAELKDAKLASPIREALIEKGFLKTTATNAKDFLGKEVEVKIDRQLGTIHPKWDFVYESNYGFIPGTISPDGEELDAYLLGIDKPVQKGSGKVIAIIHRTNDDDDKLIISVGGKDIPDEEIRKLTDFQERFFESVIIR